MPIYKVICTNCGKSYLSNADRDGLCPDCKINIRGKQHTKYRDENYDRMTVYVQKGQREIYKEFVSMHDMSLNEFFNIAIDKYKSEILDNDILEMEEISKIFAKMSDTEKEKWNFHKADDIFGNIDRNCWENDNKNVIRNAKFLYEVIKRMIDPDNSEDIAKLKNTVAPIAKKYGVERVLLFGSRARGNYHFLSDYDFMISSDKTMSEEDLHQLLIELKKTLKHRVDVITDTCDDPELIETAEKEGITIYSITG